MRIDLITPFAEKDDAKKLGAKWNGQRKCWYIVDVADLTPFMRWIPDMVAASGESGQGGEAAPAKTQKPAHGDAGRTGVLTKPQIVMPLCGCKVLPWVDCEHTLTKH